MDHICWDHHGDHVLGDVRRWGISNGCFKGRLVFFSARTGGDDDRYRIRIIRARKLRPADDAAHGTWRTVQSTPVCGSMVDRGAVSVGRSSRLAIVEPQSIHDKLIR